MLLTQYVPCLSRAMDQHRSSLFIHRHTIRRQAKHRATHSQLIHIGFLVLFCFLFFATLLIPEVVLLTSGNRLYVRLMCL